jgi:hypothetical protein
MIAAASGALLFAASHAASAAPAVNLQGAMQSPGSVDLVRQGGGGRGTVGVGGGWAGPRASGIRSGGGGGPKVGRSGGGPRVAGPRGGPKMGAYRGGGNPGRYARGPRGGDWDRGYRRGGYAWKGDRRRHYGRYFYPGIGLGLAYGGYSYYGDECGWLYRRAQATGSPYWWQRYEACRYSYY